MNSQLWVTLGASGLSLIAGYFIGNTSELTTTQGQELIGQSIHSNANVSHIGRESSNLSSRKHASRPNSARGRAEFAIHTAKAKLEESGSMMMDFGTMAEIWNTLDGLSSEELLLALKSIEDEPAMNQSSIMLRMMLLTQWGGIDGKSAAEYALSQQKGGMQQGMALMGCMTAWIKADPVAAEIWYEQNKVAFKGGMWANSNIKTMFIRGLAKRDLNAVFEKIDFNQTSERKTAIQTMGNLVTEDNLRTQVIEKVQSLEDQQLKHKMFEQMVSSLSYQDPDAAKELLIDLKNSDPEKFGEYQKSYLNGLQHMDPRAALDYASTEIADESTRKETLKSSFAQYAVNDSVAAQEWLDTQELENKDGFYKRASNRLSWQNPDKAMDWALKIGNDDKRTDEVVKVYEQWTKQHETGAQQWLGTLDEESQAAILEGVEE